ncbi:hypothetical protein Pen01_33750 [Phytomonospora endophytica]|nr:hypothetical protein Pen01_33750 [Phytomonospora endophytica]
MLVERNALAAVRMSAARRSALPRRGPTAQHIDLMAPYLDRISLAELTCQHVTAMFAELGTRTNRYGRLCAASTLQRVCATPRAVLNGAIRESLITDNPARRVELANPHPLTRGGLDARPSRCLAEDW